MAQKRKYCSKCKKRKSLLEFKRGSDGYFRWCLACTSVYNKQFFQTETGRRSIKEAQWRGLGIKNFGLNDYHKLLEQQRGCCAVCHTPSASLQLDHDHATKKVRGLLCRHCNLILGHAKDSEQILTSAIQYLWQSKRI